MGQQIKHNIRLERIMNLVADSEFGLSDEELLAEIKEVGSDPIEEAEGAPGIVREVSQTLENVSTRLTMLGHRMRSTYWRPDSAETTIKCVDCGLTVGLNVSRGKILGKVSYTPCSAPSRYQVARTGS